jgi:hypothetical protein
MPSRKHRQYLEEAARYGHSPEQAEEALRRVRAEAEDEAGYVTDLYERAMLRLDMGDPTGRQRTDAERILADRGMAGAPPEVRDVIAGMLGRMGMTVGADGAPAPAPAGGVEAGSLDELFADLAQDDLDEQEQAGQIRDQVRDALQKRPGQWLAMADIGEATGIDPEEAIALILALESLAEAGQVEQGPERYGQGPTWRARTGQEEPAQEADAEESGAGAPSGHFTTFVLAPSVSAFDYPIPFLVLGAESAQDIPHLPLPTSLHRHGNEVMAYSHKRKLEEELGPIPVSDAWIQAVAEYEGHAKIVVVQEPLPRDIATTYAEPAVGVSGQDMPPWMEPLLRQQIRAVVRDVPLSAGESALSIGIDPTAPTTLPGWAHQTITP